MNKVIKMFKDFFKKNDWKYELKDESVFITAINMGNVLGIVRMIIKLRETSYSVFLVLNSKTEEKYYPYVAEFLHRANYGLKNGNFEMDYSDGEITYKTFVNFSNTDVSEEVLEDSIYVGIAMIYKYGNGLLKIMLGEGTPEACIEECEKSEEDESI